MKTSEISTKYQESHHYSSLFIEHLGLYNSFLEFIDFVDLYILCTGFAIFQLIVQVCVKFKCCLGS